MYSFTSPKELDNRCKALEFEISMHNQFDSELYPTRPNRIKKTRWNFELLNTENQQIKQMARKAFDPAHAFVSIPENCTPNDKYARNQFSDYNGCNCYNPYGPYYPNNDVRNVKPMISQPHRVSDPAVFRLHRQQMRDENEEEEKYCQHVRSEPHRPFIEQIDFGRNQRNSNQNNSSNNSSLNDRSEQYNQKLKRNRGNHSSLSSRSKTSASDLDSTIEQFVDKIDDFKKW
ncbi:hypothetical protein TRFO_28804 [Tritrichomonas foetus]|uniref:Uncharacterized protein n=1 Tax=Tritrichomonas foetus TaxID=1144522 RepID=A0A1J4JXG5_9EUKA|nr:hypothetical protein TRFO_28804 [Tritrichomonas foetus]|eukprot:OHT03683.1 hypothetical protein TRFO_28804 [Tritrichomonas foetus]